MREQQDFEIPNLRYWLKKERQKNPFWFLDFLKKTNKYFHFIETCRHIPHKNDAPSSPIICHIHHIIPKFMLETIDEKLFRDTAENTITLSCEQHLFAHRLFAELYEDPRAVGAVTLLTCEIPEPLIREWRREGAYASHKVQKATGKGMWDPILQKRRADKSMAKADALESRSRGGKIAGLKRHIGVALKKEDCYMFSYKNQEVLGIINCKTGGQVLAELKRCIPDKTLKRVSPL